jgi:hypothetical protein
MEAFSCPIKEFPCKYLGLPLHVRAIRRVDIQPLIDKVGGKMASWKGNLLNRAGRLRFEANQLSAFFFTNLFFDSFQAAKMGN